MSGENAPAEPNEGEEAAEQQPQEQTQEAWAARRDLDAHAPRSMTFDGTNHGVTAQQIIGDIHHYNFGGYAAAATSGEIPRETLDRLADAFVGEGTDFDALLARLRHERVLVLTGDPHTGRRTAALMLLRAVGAAPVHSVDRDTKPESLTPVEGRGHVLFDLAVSRTQPLREAQLFAVRDRLREKGSYLVITTAHSPYVEDTVPLATWRPPAPRAVLSALLHRQTDAATAERLLALRDTTDFLAREQQLREVVPFAAVLLHADETTIRQYSRRAVELQVQEWFEEGEDTQHLREKAFLIALAAFNNGPYALTAELSDKLYERLRSTGADTFNEPIPVFGTHIGKRLQTARAQLRTTVEETEWGQVSQPTAAFKDERIAPVLLREVWTGHPAARPALIKWLDQLSTDGRPFVRTRAAATVAVLALTDLPSAMALIIERWAGAKDSRQQLTAVGALTLAHRIDAPNIPRIIDGWSTGDTSAQRCWVAVRAQGLIGPERPVEALAALRAQARRQDAKERPDQHVVDELPESVALLLLSTAADTALAELLRTLDDHPAVRTLTLGGFLAACSRTDDPLCPPVLAWATRSGSAAPGIARLLRIALGDREHNEQAENVLRDWVRAADRDPGTERALAALLPALAGGPREAARLDHLLDTVQGLDGRPQPAAAARLRAGLALARTDTPAAALSGV
ncbi:hypothetical protein [Streptomyces goshikiensis]|uniref:hypothetical protein n=1 Tax=Streptomyces goshikiensis TaxID=1942 RepID=UPI0036952789